MALDTFRHSSSSYEGYLIQNRTRKHSRKNLRVGVTAGIIVKQNDIDLYSNLLVTMLVVTAYLVRS